MPRTTTHVAAPRRSRRARLIAAILAALAAVPVGSALPAAPAQAAPAGDGTPVAFLVRGVGNGHGRGLSQWGAYGRAVDGGQTWQQILDAYYGGTTNDTRTLTGLTVRLTKWDGAAVLGVVSYASGVRWNGFTYASMYARETSPGTFQVYGSNDHACPAGVGLTIPKVDLVQGSTGTSVQQMQQFLSSFGYAPGPVDGIFGSQTEAAVVRFQNANGLAADGEWHQAEWTKAEALSGGGGTTAWTPLATGSGTVTFTTTVSQYSSVRGDLLGACEPDGSITHYRGKLAIADTTDGNRVVNTLDIESYLRGVIPKEVPASWGGAGAGSGMNALRAQAVAARSYAMTQSRYPYARTCDTSSCQVYGGAAERASAAAAGYVAVENALTDQGVVDTKSIVRVRGADVVSTEFSASNGPRTAGGAYPAVDDPWDDQPGNPNHRWTRIIDADTLAAFCGQANANSVRTRRDAASIYDGIWSNEITNCAATSDPLSLRNAMGYPTHGFDLVPITRGATTTATFSFIGDSVGEGITGTATAPFRMTLDGVFASSTFDSRVSRRTQGGTIPDGVGAAQAVPRGTDFVLVELGYNDDPAAMPARIDAVMTALRTRGVGRVAWVNLSERRPEFAATNAALHAAIGRWDDLVVFDWESASDHRAADRWFADNVHLTSTGTAEFTAWLRKQLISVVTQDYAPPRPLVPGAPLRVPVLGQFGVPTDGSVTGVALNVTAVAPDGPGWLRVWPCGSAEPSTSSVNFVSAGAVEPNAVVVPVDATGEVCIRTKAITDVLVDVSGWFDSGLRSASGRLVDTRDDAIVSPLRPSQRLVVPATGRFGIPDDGTAVGVALNVTAVGPEGPGWLRVWPCDGKEPGTSAVNYMAAGVIEPNAVVVPVAADGTVCVSTRTRTEAIVDVTGWFDGGLRSASGRLLDTRTDGQRRTLSPGEIQRVSVVGRFGVPSDGTAVGVALNVTAVDPNGPGWLRVWSCDAAQPDTSAVNYVRAGAIEPNAVMAPIGASGEVCIRSLTDTEVLVDLTGWFDAGLHGASGRLVDTRIGVGPIPGR